MKWRDVLKDVDTTGRKWENSIPVAITMTPGPPPVNTMTRRILTNEHRWTDCRFSGSEAESTRA